MIKLPANIQTVSSDIDGCVAQVDKALVAKYAKVFDMSPAKAYEEIFVKTAYDHRHPFIKDYCYNDPDFWFTLEPFADNVAALQRFRNQDGSRLYFNTARPDELREVTEAWLDKTFGILGYDGVLMGTKDKKQVAAEFVGAQVHIDDRFKEAQTFISTDIQIIMINKVYNVKDRQKDGADQMIWVDALKYAGGPFA